MKASTLLKTLIVLVAIGVIAYIVHNSNKAAKINNLVSAPAEQYEFAQHVDSMCATIQAASDLTKAKQAYNQIYEELDVYAQIKKNNGEALIEQTEQDKLFDHAFKAYWAKIEKEAEELFNKTNWTPKQNIELRNEIKRLIPTTQRGKFNRGISKAQQDALKKYKRYFNGYDKFASLLKALENCENAETYDSLQYLSDYEEYPYSNLTEFQIRRKNAGNNAKTHWQNLLKNQWSALNSRNVPLIIDSVQLFSNDVDVWEAKVNSYCKTTQDKEYFSQMETNIENKNRKLISSLEESHTQKQIQ